MTRKDARSDVANLVLFILHDQVTANSTSRYGHTLAFVRRWDETKGETDCLYSHESIWQGLQARCQYHHTDGDTWKHSQEGSYAWEVGFDVSHSMITLRDVERYAPQLKSLQKKLDVFDSQFGPATTYGAFVVRLGLASGIKRWSWNTSKGFQRATKDASDVLYFVDEHIAKFHAGDVPVSHSRY